MSMKFIVLKHGQLLMAEYVATFETLSKQGTNFINTLPKKNQKFIYCFTKTLRNVLLPRLETSFKKLVDTALRLHKVDKESGDKVQKSKGVYNRSESPIL